MSKLSTPSGLISDPGFRDIRDGQSRNRFTGKQSGDTAPLVRKQSAPDGMWARKGYIFTDVVLMSLNMALVYILGYGPLLLARLRGFEVTSSAIADPHLVRTYIAILLIYVPLIVLTLEAWDLYRLGQSRSNTDVTLAVAKAIAIVTVVLTGFICLSGMQLTACIVVALSGLLNLVSLAAWRIWRRRVTKRCVENDEGGRNVLIVGAGRTGQELARYLTARKELGYVVKGFLDINHSDDPRVLGHIRDLSRVARAKFVDEIFITVPSERDVVRAVTSDATRDHLDVKLVPELFGGLGLNAPLDCVGDLPVVELHREPIPTIGLFAKRAMDVTAAAAGLVLLSPLFALIAAAIKIDDPGPVFYTAPRIGMKGRKFVCYKFRSMMADADNHKDQLRRLNERSGPFFKMSNDPRVTRVGKLLRKFSLDELPQIWNVFKGDMSLVGPRPHPTDDFQHYQLEHLRRLDVTPGITGLWQVTARQDPSFENNLRLDIEYINNWNLWLDVKILLKTIPAVLRGTGQ